MVKVSIIIPTYNGAHKITNILRALENQTYTDFEVIVVVDGSNDSTVSILKSKDFAFKNFKIIDQKNQGRGKVRNTGAKVAQGEILIFFDDDMRPIPDCVFHHVQHHVRFPNTIVTGNLCEEKNKCKNDIQLFKAYLSDKWGSALLVFKGKPLTKDVIFISAANFSVSAKIFNQLEGFDEKMNDVEDYDLALRAFKNNIPLFYDFDAFAWHDDFITCKGYIRRLRQYKIALNELQINKSILCDELDNRKLIMPKGLKGIIFKLFANYFWIKIIDKFNFFLILPKEIRYKIYDLVITANGVYYSDKVKF